MHRPEDFGAEDIELSKIQFTPELLSCIPAEMARRLHVLPVYQVPGRTGIATADPSDLNSIDTLNHHLNQVIEIFVTDKTLIDSFIERLYPK